MGFRVWKGGCGTNIRQPRHQDFRLSIGFPGLDLTEAEFTFQFRENKEAPDPALLDLANAAEGANGIYATLLSVDGADYTEVVCTAAVALLDLIPQASPLGSDLPGFYGFKIDGVEYLAGDFILEGQANHA